MNDHEVERALADNVLNNDNYRREGYDAYHDAQLLASALLSLAAQSEELRADLEKERADREVLDRALEDMEAWQAAHKDPIHDLIVAHSELGALESRYSALVMASRALEGVVYEYLERDPKHPIADFELRGSASALHNALGALLDSEASGVKE